MAKNQVLTLTVRIAGQMDRSLTAALSGTNSSLATVTRNLSRIGTVGLAAVGAFATGTVKLLKDCTNKAVEFEQSMSDVTKYVSGLADANGKVSNEVAKNGKTFKQNYEQMSDAIMELSTQVPYTMDDLTKLAAAAGQSGKSMEDILSGGFLRDVAKWGSAMDISADLAGEYAAKWEIAFKMTHSEIMDLADVINYLGANTPTTADAISHVVNDTASLGQIAGVNVKTTAALGDALLAMGVSENRVATSIKRMYTQLILGSSATKAMKEQYEALGLTAEGVAKGMIADSTGTILDLFTRIGNLPQYQQGAALKNLFGQWAIESAAKLEGNMDAFTNALAMVNDPSLYTGSMEREFTIKSDTAEAMSGMAERARDMFMIHIGDEFLDVQKQVDMAWRDFYLALDENLPALKQLAGALADLATGGLAKLSDVIQDTLPYINRFLNSLGFGNTDEPDGDYVRESANKNLTGFKSPVGNFLERYLGSGFPTGERLQAVQATGDSLRAGGVLPTFQSPGGNFMESFLASGFATGEQLQKTKSLYEEQRRRAGLEDINRPKTNWEKIVDFAAPKFQELLEYVANNGPQVVDALKKAFIVLIGLKLSPLLNVGAGLLTTGAVAAGGALTGIGNMIFGTRVGGSVAGGAATRSGGLAGLFRTGQAVPGQVGNVVTAAQTGAATAAGAGGSRILGGFLGLGNVANLTGGVARRRSGAINTIERLVRGDPDNNVAGITTLRGYLGNRIANSGVGRFFGNMGTNLRGIANNGIVTGIGSRVTGGLNSIRSFFGGGLNGIRQSASDFFYYNPVGSTLSMYGGLLRDWGAEKVQNTRNRIGNLRQSLSDFFYYNPVGSTMSMYGGMLRDWGSERVQNIRGGLSNLRQSASDFFYYNPVGSTLSMYGGMLRDWGSEKVQNARGRLGAAGAFLRNGLTTAGGAVGRFAGNAGQLLGSVAGGVRSVAGAALPVLAAGGRNLLGLGGNILGMAGTAWGPVAGMFGSITAGAVPVVGAISGIIAVVSILGDHFEDIRTLIGKIFGDKGLQVFDTFTGKISGIGDKIKGALGITNFMQIFSPAAVQSVMLKLMTTVSPILSNLFGSDFAQGFNKFIIALTPIVSAVMGIIGKIVLFANNTVKPIIEQVFGFIVNTVMPKILNIFTAASPIIANILTGFGNGVMSVMGLIGDVINAVLPIIEGLISKFLDIAAVVLPVLLDGFNQFVENISPIIENVRGIFQGVIDFITGVFTGDWEKAWNGVKDIFSNAFNALETLLKTPLNVVIRLINKAIDGINDLGLDIPDWVPVIGGSKFHIDIPTIPELAKGGFTNGPSIAGEAGREAVISFNRAYRASNIATWAKAGQMLGVNKVSPFKEIPESSNAKAEFVFSPNITIQGNASRDDIEAAMMEAYRMFEQNFETMYNKMEKQRARRAYS